MRRSTRKRSTVTLLEVQDQVLDTTKKKKTTDIKDKAVLQCSDLPGESIEDTECRVKPATRSRSRTRKINSEKNVQTESNNKRRKSSEINVKTSKNGKENTNLKKSKQDDHTVQTKKKNVQEIKTKRESIEQENSKICSSAKQLDIGKDENTFANSSLPEITQNHYESSKITKDVNFENYKAIDLSHSIKAKKKLLETPPAAKVNSSCDIEKEKDIRSMLLQFEYSDGNVFTKASGDEDSEDDSDWEAVEEADHEIDTEVASSSQVPSEAVEITLEHTNIMRTKKKKKFDMNEWFRLQLNKFRRHTQSNVHKVHLLCLIAHGRYMSTVSKSTMLQGLMMSHIPTQFQKVKPQKCTIKIINALVSWFHEKFSFSKGEVNTNNVKKQSIIEDDLLKAAETCVADNKSHLVYLFMTVLRIIHLETRLVISVYPVSFKAADLKVKNPEKLKVSHQGSDMKKSPGNSQSKDTKLSSKRRSVSTSDKECKSPSSVSLNEQNKASKKSQKLTGDSSKNCAAKKSITPTHKNSKAAEHYPACKVKIVVEDYDENLKKEESVFKLKSNVSKKSKSSVKPKNKSRRKSASKIQNYCELSGQSDSEPEEKRKKAVTSNYSKSPKSLSEISEDTSDSSHIFSGSQQSSSEDEFQPKFVEFRSPNVKKNVSKARKIGSANRKKRVSILSSDSDNSLNAVDGKNMWLEVYLETEKRWICIDCVHNVVDETSLLEEGATQPVQYILAFFSAGHVKDITKKYVRDWMSFTRKLRHDEAWFQETMLYFEPPNNEKTADEDKHIEAKLLSQPIPSAISDIKNHPLYAMKRHLLKFEAIYPVEAPPLGFVRNEPVYARECVHTLHSRENWIKEGRAVRVGEEAYKWVKSRPKRNRTLNTNEPTLALFGHWQTEVYVPPPAVDGKVPRNEYGNVELFKPSMLPAGTVHLHGFPGLNRVARKLGLDAVPAMTGWDQHGGFPHPVLEGWVVCVEHKDMLVAAWDEQQEIDREKEQDKREKRVLENWRKLTKGLLIKQKIKKKYNFQENQESPHSVHKWKGKTQKKVDENCTKASDVAMSWPLNREAEKAKSQANKPTKKNCRRNEEGSKFPFEIETM